MGISPVKNPRVQCDFGKRLTKVEAKHGDSTGARGKPPWPAELFPDFRTFILSPARFTTRSWQGRNFCRNFPTFWSGIRPGPQAGRAKTNWFPFRHASKAWRFCRNLNRPGCLMGTPLGMRQYWNEARERLYAGKRGRPWDRRKRRAHVCYGPPLLIFLHGLLPLVWPGCVMLTSRVEAGQAKVKASGAAQALNYLMRLVCFY